MRTPVFAVHAHATFGLERFKRLAAGADHLLLPADDPPLSRLQRQRCYGPEHERTSAATPMITGQETP